MYKYKITVFTPTYNRGYIIENLYRSLKEQTFKDFEWLIVDDGSNDDTKNLINKFIDEGVLNINYIVQKNGGKHSAMNTGAENAKGELFFTVDSDDRLVEDALETVSKIWNGIDDKKNISGIMGLCIHQNGNIIGTTIPEDKKVSRMIDLYLKYGVKGDKSVIITTEIMKKFKFPVKEDVKFLPENLILHKISKNYNIVTVNKPMIVREYLEDGLTKNTLSKNYINGMAFAALCSINDNLYGFSFYPELLLREYINLYKFSKISNIQYNKDLNKGYKKIIYTLLTPISHIYYKKLLKHI